MLQRYENDGGFLDGESRSEIARLSNYTEESHKWIKSMITEGNQWQKRAYTIDDVKEVIEVFDTSVKSLDQIFKKMW